MYACVHVCSTLTTVSVIYRLTFFPPIIMDGLWVTRVIAFTIALGLQFISKSLTGISASNISFIGGLFAIHSHLEKLDPRLKSQMTERKARLLQIPGGVIGPEGISNVLAESLLNSEHGSDRCTTANSNQ